MKFTFFIFLLGFTFFPIISEEGEVIEKSCNDLLNNASIILTNDVYANSPELQETHNTPTKKKIFEKSNAFKDLKKQLKADKDILLKCKFSFIVPWGIIRNVYDQKRKAFLMYNGDIAADDIMIFGKNNSKGIVSFDISGEEVTFRSPRYALKDNNPILQIQFSKGLEIGDMPSFPVTLGNAGKNYALLEVHKDTDVVQIEDCIEKGCGLQLKITFQLSPDILNWKYGQSPMGSYIKQVIKTKNLKIILEETESSKEIKVWNGKN